MKNETTKKITALGVVIFSFVSILIYVAIALCIDCLTVLLVWKTELAENFLKIGSVLSSGIGLVVSTIFLTLQTKWKGIYAAGIMFALVIIIKLIGNASMNLGGYFSINGIIGMLFTLVFAFVGGIMGSMLKK